MRSLQGICNELCVDSVADLPTNNRSGIQVDYGCQVQPARRGLQIRDVANPVLVGLGGGKVAFDQVRRDAEIVV